ncbi:MAG: conjugal transfer protein TraF [Cyanobacteria bacterium]|nr:conjugal transfer protein TraF [Cyanobacteriota bacterium]
MSDRKIAQKTARPFYKSIWVVLVILASVVLSGFTVNWISLSQLPSSFDKGLTIQTAFKQAKTPLLIEFYSDTCSTCQRLTPLMHQIYLERYPKELTWVMIDMDQADNAPIAQLFGVNELPAVFLFDPRRMKKQRIELGDFVTPQSLTQAISNGVSLLHTAKKPSLAKIASSKGEGS